MNSTETKDISTLDEILHATFEKQRASGVIQEIRSVAFQNFTNLGFPTVKHEEWKYSNVGAISKTNYDFKAKSDFSQTDLEQIPLPHLKGNILYFVNGIYHPELSEIISDAKKIQILPFSQAIAENHEIIVNYFGKLANNQGEAFTALNTALASDGVVIKVKKHQIVEEPIILRFISDSRQGNVGANVRNLIVVEENAQVKIAEAYRTMGEEKVFVNSVTEIVVEKSAMVDYYKVQNESDHSHHIGTTQVWQGESSYFYAATTTLNGGFVRNNLNIVLGGEHVESHLYGLYVPNGKQHVDNHTLVDHQMPNCESNELYKGILMDKSTGVFNGKIFVRQDAQKTNAYQNCRNVVTSDEAVMNTKPQLEIWADDVKCSHGTTTGQLNDDAIFYMQARGIPKKEAVRLQLLAFAQDVVSQIKIDSIREYIEELIHEKLEF